AAPGRRFTHCPNPCTDHEPDERDEATPSPRLPLGGSLLPPHAWRDRTRLAQKKYGRAIVPWPGRFGVSPSSCPPQPRFLRFSKQASSSACDSSSVKAC